MLNKYIYELYSSTHELLYKNTNLNFVFHEYISYLKYENMQNLIIKKKLNDNNKKFPLYVEIILYNGKYFESKTGRIYNYIYENLSVSDNVSSVSVNNINNKKILLKKPFPKKVKIINFNKEDLNKKTDDNVKNDIYYLDNEEKLKELEELINKMEKLKDEQLEELEKEKEILQNKDTEDRKNKMFERTMNDKRKELLNIFEADKRLYYKFNEIIMEVNKLKDNIKNNIEDKRKNSELTKAELTAKALVKNNKDFEIPLLFIHKYPIFNFLDNNKLLNNDYAFLAFKQIYYKNYELTTESRKYFGDKVYLFNEEDEILYNKNFNHEQKNLIQSYSNELNNKTIDIEKIITKNIDKTTNFINKIKIGEEISESESDSDSDYSEENNNISCY